MFIELWLHHYRNNQNYAGAAASNTNGYCATNDVDMIMPARPPSQCIKKITPAGTSAEPRHKKSIRIYAGMQASGVLQLKTCAAETNKLRRRCGAKNFTPALRRQKQSKLARRCHQNLRRCCGVYVGSPKENRWHSTIEV